MEKNTFIPDFDSLWDYNHPADTERKFCELLPAAESSGDKTYLIELLTQIARTQGLQRKFDDAHETLDKAEKLLSHEMPVPEIRYLLERGRTFNSSGSPEKAKPLFLKAWELGQRYGADNYAVDAAHMVAITETPGEALKWNEKAVEFAEKSHDGKAKKWLGSLYNNIGWNYHDKKEYEKALEYFRKDLEWYSDKNRPMQTRIARWSVARTLRSLSRLTEALALQRSILDGIIKNNEEHDGYVYEEIGECLLALGKAEESKSHFKQAYELLSKDIWLAANEQQRLDRLKKLGEVS